MFFSCSYLSFLLQFVFNDNAITVRTASNKRLPLHSISNKRVSFTIGTIGLPRLARSIPTWLDSQQFIMFSK